MNVDPHWLEPLVLAVIGWVLKDYLKRIAEGLKKLDELVTDVAVIKERTNKNEGEIGNVRGRLERAFGWTPLPRRAPHNGDGEP